MECQGLLQVQEMQTFLLEGLSHAMMRQDTDLLYKYVYCRNLSLEVVRVLECNFLRWQETALAKGLSAHVLSEWFELLVRMEHVMHGLIQVVYDTRGALRAADLTIQDIQTDMQLNSKMLEMQAQMQAQMGAHFYNVVT